MSGIPRVIFQTWKSKHDFPWRCASWRDSFVTFNPSYSQVLWDDQDNFGFIRESYPWFLPTYRSYRAEIYRVDAVRYFYLYEYGGIYADIDTECVRPLDELVDIGGVVLGQMGHDEQYIHSIPNAVMLSEPGAEFWLLVISLMMERSKSPLRPEWITGPILLRDALNLYQDEDRQEVRSRIAAVASLLSSRNTIPRSDISITVLPPDAFYPLAWNSLEAREILSSVKKGDLLSSDDKASICQDSWMISYWEHSWG